MSSIQTVVWVTKIVRFIRFGISVVLADSAATIAIEIGTIPDHNGDCGCSSNYIGSLTASTDTVGWLTWIILITEEGNAVRLLGGGSRGIEFKVGWTVLAISIWELPRSFTIKSITQFVSTFEPPLDALAAIENIGSDIVINYSSVVGAIAASILYNLFSLAFDLIIYNNQIILWETENTGSISILFLAPFTISSAFHTWIHTVPRWASCALTRLEIEL